MMPKVNPGLLRYDTEKPRENSVYANFRTPLDSLTTCVMAEE
jgi:hypothetical protein